MGTTTVVGTAASGSTDYATLANVKAELEIESGDTTWDSVLTRMITEASRLIDRWTKRQAGGFTGQTQTKTLTSDSARRLWLPEPLISVTTLETDEDGDRTYETTWAVTDYRLVPLEGPPFTRIEVDSINGIYSFPTHEAGIQIEGSWGEAATAPEPIERATILQVARLKARLNTPEGVAGSDEGGFIQIGELDPDVKSILRSGGYRKVKI